MDNITIIGRSKSKSVSEINKNTSINRYSHKCSGIVNYGLAGEAMKNFVAKHPSITNKPIINRFVGCSKYKAIKDAEKGGITVPETLLALPTHYKKDTFLSKMLHSQGGKGIIKATSCKQVVDRYYQKFITNRRYELRIHSFAWIDQKEWAVQKRLGKDDVIAWNFHNGGHFQTVHNPNAYKIFSYAKEISGQILKIRNMSFGAVDFVVTNDDTLYFLEINSAPGFTELSKGIYIGAMSRLTTLTKKEFITFCT